MARQKPRGSASRKRVAFRPGLEQLEDRIYAPGLKSANQYGFVTIKQLMDEANAALANPGSFSRDYLETLKKALDAANNNLNFVL